MRFLIGFKHLLFFGLLVAAVCLFLCGSALASEETVVVASGGGGGTHGVELEEDAAIF